MKKIISATLATLLLCGSFTACSPKPQEEGSDPSGFDTTKEITVISREDGSGTRGAFTELFGIIEKDAEGKKHDMTVETADITQSTGVMLTSVADNQNAIGYISLGSLNDTVKALKIDGAAASVEDIKNGSYKISRPFNILTMGKESEAAADFIAFIMSEDGQKVVEEHGYISNENTGKFTSKNPSGKITIAGSSSVTPVMEKLKEAYAKVNSALTIEINQSDSTSGVNNTVDGVCDIGMASRELSESESAKGVKNTVIALDGIAVIVNKANTTEDLSVAAVKDIYTGNAITWAELSK
ncbi:MAG: substrate-binding domain-containing protein [Oscillospiraceae bacterium]